MASQSCPLLLSDRSTATAESKRVDNVGGAVVPDARHAHNGRVAVYEERVNAGHAVHSDGQVRRLDKVGAAQRDAGTAELVMLASLCRAA